MELRQYWPIFRRWVGLVIAVGVMGGLGVLSLGWKTELIDPPAAPWRAAAAMPDLIPPAMTTILDSPVVTPEATLSPAAYPLPSLAPPTRTPLPADYVLPPTRQLDGIATAAPAGVDMPAPTRGDSTPGPGPRVWLYVTFVGSALVLVISLTLMVDHGRQGKDNPEGLRPDDDQGL
jgi:hypothetical protein